MGKVRIKTLGIEEEEKKQAKDTQRRKEGKALRLAHGKKLAKGAHGGERVVSMAPTEEEVLRELTNEKTATTGSTDKKIENTEASVKSVVARKTRKQSVARQRSKRYRDLLIQIDKSKNYTLSEAVELLKKMGGTRFDGTVELHINTIEKGINGQVTLPHGTGKTVRVAIADPTAGSQLDSLLKEIEGGKIGFDVLIAHPAAMAKLAKVAKILGPRGLMPNPKSGTISEQPGKIAERFKGGQVNFRTESQAPIIHAAVGKDSFSQKDLSDNIVELIKAIGPGRVRSITLKSTMSPGMRVDVQSIL